MKKFLVLALFSANCFSASCEDGKYTYKDLVKSDESYKNIEISQVLERSNACFVKYRSARKFEDGGAFVFSIDSAAKAIANKPETAQGTATLNFLRDLTSDKDVYIAVNGPNVNSSDIVLGVYSASPDDNVPSFTEVNLSAQVRKYISLER